MAQFSRILDATNRSIVNLQFPLHLSPCRWHLAPRVSSMDPSIFNLLEEDDEGESILSEDVVDAFHNSLIQAIEVQGGPISATSKKSVTEDQTVGPLSSVVYVKQEPIDQSFDQAEKPRSLVQHGVTTVPLKQNNAKPISLNDYLEKQYSKMVLSTSTTCAGSVPPSTTTQQDSRMMVNFPVPFETIPKGANVRTTSILPSVGQMNPSRKKQKLSGNSSDGSTKKFNDVFAVSGISLREEEKQLLSFGPKKDGYVSKTSPNVVHEEEERTILRKVPLQRKLTEIMAKSGLKHIDHDVERCLSLCVKERMRGLLSNIIQISKQLKRDLQGIDAEKYSHRTFITSDIGKQINEMNQKVKEEWKKRHAGEEKNEESDTEKEDNRLKKEKAKKEEEHRMRVKAANVASHKAVGGESGYDMFLKWKLMAEVRQKTSPVAPRNIKKLPSETGLTNVVRSISVKDVIAAREKESKMSRSTLLYRLYSRVCSEDPIQDVKNF